MIMLASSKSEEAKAQLEQIEMGVGEKLGLVLQMAASCIISFIFFS